MSHETGESHLSAIDLEQSFQIGRARINVLKGISLEVRSGEVVFLCGASGAGKTTLLYTLAGLERPREGRVSFEGADIYAPGCATAGWALSFKPISFCPSSPLSKM